MNAFARIGMTVLVLAVVASVAHAGAGLTWRMMGLTPTPLPQVIRAVEATPPPDIAPILALAPFGDPVPLAPPPVAAIEADEDRLRELSLRGVIVAVPASQSRAMIVAGAEAVKTYGIGQSPLPGVTLISVQRDGAVFEANGREVTLSFTTEADRRAAGVDRVRNVIPEKFRSGAQSGPAGAGRGVDAVIDFYRQKIRANPQTVLDGFGVALTDGGYEIGPTPSIGVTRAGLRPGDIIAKVNGQAVGNIEADRRLFEKVATSGTVRVEILRNGRRVILSFPLK